MHHVDERGKFSIGHVGYSMSRVDKHNNHVHLSRDLDYSLFKIIPGLLELIEA